MIATTKTIIHKNLLELQALESKLTQAKYRNKKQRQTVWASRILLSLVLVLSCFQVSLTYPEALSASQLRIKDLSAKAYNSGREYAFQAGDALIEAKQQIWNLYDEYFNAAEIINPEQPEGSFDESQKPDQADQGEIADQIGQIDKPTENEKETKSAENSDTEAQISTLLY